MPREHSKPNFSSLFSLTNKQTLPGEPQPTSHATRKHLSKLLSTSFAQEQTDIASQTSTNITCHTNIPYETPLHRFCSRRDKVCLGNLNQHHMPYEHSRRNFSTPHMLTHTQTLPRESQRTSQARRTFTKKLHFTYFAHTQTNTASHTSNNITCHTNIPHHTPLHLFCSGTDKPCVSNLKQHHMPHEHSPRNYSSPLLLTHRQTLPREPQRASHAARTFFITLLFISFAHARTKHCLANLNQHYMPHEHFSPNHSSSLLLTHKQTLPRESQPTLHAT